VTAEVTGKAVLVTGSTDGLGRARALEPVAGGATVASARSERARLGRWSRRMIERRDIP